MPHQLNQLHQPTFTPTPSFIALDVPLADKNWFKTGGNAAFYAEPTNAQEFKQALKFAQEQDLQLVVLGEGANILISDDGVAGLVIRPKIMQIHLIADDKAHAFVEAGAGVSFKALIDWCLENQLIGLEEFSGIPGTVGGSVFINIHYFEHLLSHFLVSAQVINKETGSVSTVDAQWFCFGYNYSTLHQETHYLLSATFKLKKSDAPGAAYARGRADETIRHRHKRYPTTGTCGSFFRNFHEDELTGVCCGKKLIYIAYYLDKIGVKGELSVGDAVVSYQHANMIVNRGKATTTDIITLAQTMQKLVYNQFGIMPQPECRLIGFQDNPL